MAGPAGGDRRLLQRRHHQQDLDGTITSWNAAAEQLFGYSAAQAIGQNLRLVVPPDPLGEEASILDRVRRGDAVGRVGSEGNVTGPHLHYEVRRDGEPVDPLDWASPP